jgi:predicted nucleic acid-binding protein
MAYLVDTSVLARLANSADISRPAALHAVIALHRQGETLHTSPQNLIEFRNCATRPISANGLGLLPAIVEQQSAAFETAFGVLPESAGIYPEWKRLVAAVGIVGKQVHDARLAAICVVHGISHVLTFNVGHFQRLAAAASLQIVSPDQVTP